MTRDVGLIGGTLLLLMLIVLAWLSRDRRTRRFRIGFFMERERDDEEPPDE